MIMKKRTDKQQEAWDKYAAAALPFFLAAARLESGDAPWNMGAQDLVNAAAMATDAANAMFEARERNK
jgi:hypothetical protein